MLKILVIQIYKTSYNLKKLYVFPFNLCENYLPIQNLLKMLPRISSEVIVVPVISPR
ncbi:MAG: hypothetical protein PWR20_914 [Bacteroidales bacterium]|jgi:hypothetical protein|nr:hypothetical protein [Bacteroidales bacterium]MDN5329887.1 hypothetical protein [Bacteroidales bacterium]